MNSAKPIDDAPVPVRIKLSLLWASLMSLYIYNDYFVLFVPGTIDSMALGSMGPLGTYTDGKMVVVALVLIIPACMVFLSSMLSPRLSRILNLILGVVYAMIALLTLIGSPMFYKLVVCFELVAISLIIKCSYLMNAKKKSFSKT